MKRISFFLFALLGMAAVANASQTKLEGFAYGDQVAPDGKEWESPQRLALNKEQPHAYFFSFASVENARKVLPENSKYWQSLDGTWKFNWVKTPAERPVDFYKPTFDVSHWDDISVPSSWNIYGIQKNGDLKYGLPIYVNQPVIFYHKVAVDDWRGGVMRTPPTNWTTYIYRNEVGSYRRTFTIPKDWDGREVFINFDGVDSFFYLWINGHYVGFSKNSRNTASFDITRFLKKGENIVAAEVYRNSDGSFLESQDMFRLPGIFRTVALHAKSKVQIRDLQVIPSFNGKNGELAIKAEIKNFTHKKLKKYSIEYSLYENKLYSDENSSVSGVSVTPTSINMDKKTESTVVNATLKANNVKAWSAESPVRYTLVAQLKDKRGRVVETVSTYTGFRSVVIKDTKAKDDEFGLAGRYYYINGKTVKLKGVNRHETNPALGHAITHKQMEEEVMLMKRANINHVRNSHYTDNPYWYYLCNKYGVYLEDEANIESHEYYYGAASLSHPIEWRPAHVARVMEMVHANINNPAIVIWSLGNEAGPGKNFVAAYDALKKVDLSRPVQYERNNDIVDMGSNQYPSIAWVNEAVKGKYNIKYPFHISEYAHSMGNACGNLIDYWNAIESTNYFCGGAIWDWVDQAMYNYDKKSGERYEAYGGDFGDYPNDGQFVMNGIMFADLSPKPQYFEVKKVYQYIGMKAIDVEKGEFQIFNKNYFTSLNDYSLRWSIYQDGKEITNGNLSIDGIAPRTKQKITINYGNLKMRSDAEYFVKLQCILKNDEPWAKKGYVQAEEQMLLKSATLRPTVASLSEKDGAKAKISQSSDSLKTVVGDGFVLNFDMKTGSIFNLKYGNETIISDGNGPKIDALRAFTNNDNWFYSEWFANGLHNLVHKATDANVFEKADGTVIAAFTVVSQAPNAARIEGGTSSGHNKIVELKDKPFGENDFKFTTNQIWTVYPDGSVELQASITSNRPTLTLPRLGYVIEAPKYLDRFSYYGRGPIDNYADRKSGQFIEQFSSSVADQMSNFPKPQDNGNHEDTRWCALTNEAGNGAIFVSNDKMSVSALPYSPVDMILAPHPYQLPKVTKTYLHLDMAVTGLGGNSCGQGGPLKPDRVYATPHSISFVIRPAKVQNLTEQGNVSLSGVVPITIARDRKGEVSISSAKIGEPIVYTVGKSKPAVYTKPFALRNGGEVSAWFESSKALKNRTTFNKIETVAMEVVAVSSEEAGEGNATHLVDGDPNTIWHTMYSVTVAKYPHWVEFDAGEVKNIKGFTYLPRPGGGNGNIKDYSIEVSNDGKNWGKPIIKSSFANDATEKKVIFSKVVKGRYVRFTALSEQNGQDFASGAEFTLLAE